MATKRPPNGRITPPVTTPGENGDVRSPGTPGGSNIESFFEPAKKRADSIYSLSRASFSHQLSQLTSLSLPDSSSLLQSVEAIPNAPAATKALLNAAEQIQQWIKKAAEVLGGLDAADDVEWAAAGGRDGLEDVDSAIVKFQELVNVFVQAIEHLRKRKDIKDVPKAELTRALDTLDQVLTSWAQVSRLLKEVKRQVELALEWEELWNTVLGEIGMELGNLSQLVFRIEEKRYQGGLASLVEAGASLDIKDLETIVEESPAGESPLQRPRGKPALNRGVRSQPQSTEQELPPTNDSGLLELFARMQPLKASLDFIPMRLSAYRAQAESILPSACDELDTRREGLEKQYNKLEEDAEKIRKELGEDKWVAVFTNAGRQAQTLCESLERGMMKVQEAFDGAAPNIPGSVARRINDYQGKRENYGPAIQKIIQVINKGINERRTVNGECLRILDDLKIHWRRLESQLKQVDSALEEYQQGKSPQHMRDSLSSIMSNDRSTTESTVDTPDSSPASSVVIAPPSKKVPATPDTATGKRRSMTGNRPASLQPPRSTGISGTSLARRLGYTPGASNRLSTASPSPAPRPGSRTSVSSRAGASSRQGASSRAGASTPTLNNRGTPVPRQHGGRPVPIPERPRWNSGVRPDEKSYEKTYRPLSLTGANPNMRSLNGKPIHRQNAAPSPGPHSHAHAQRSASTRTMSGTVATRSPLWRESSAPPGAAGSPSGGGLGARHHTPLRAASSLALRTTGATGPGSPSPAMTPRTSLSSTLAAARGALRPHERTYTPSTPRQGPTPRIASTGSASGSKRLSLLPMTATHRLSIVPGSSPTTEDSPSRGPLSRPATSLGMTTPSAGKRNSLLPMPVGDR